SSLQSPVSSLQSPVSSLQSPGTQHQAPSSRDLRRASNGKLSAMLLNPFKRRDDPHMLAVSMTGVKMGDRVAFVGCAHGGRLAAVASKVGLSGRAVAIVPDGRAAELARKGAEQMG